MLSRNISRNINVSTTHNLIILAELYQKNGISHTTDIFQNDKLYQYNIINKTSDRKRNSTRSSYESITLSYNIILHFFRCFSPSGGAFSIFDDTVFQPRIPSDLSTPNFASAVVKFHFRDVTFRQYHPTREI